MPFPLQFGIPHRWHIQFLFAIQLPSHWWVLFSFWGWWMGCRVKSDCSLNICCSYYLCTFCFSLISPIVGVSNFFLLFNYHLIEESLFLWFVGWSLTAHWIMLSLDHFHSLELMQRFYAVKHAFFSLTILIAPFAFQLIWSCSIIINHAWFSWESSIFSLFWISEVASS